MNPLKPVNPTQHDVIVDLEAQFAKAQSHLDGFRRLFNSLVPTSSQLKNPDGFSLPESLNAFDMVAAGELDALKSENARLVGTMLSARRTLTSGAPVIDGTRIAIAVQILDKELAAREGGA